MVFQHLTHNSLVGGTVAEWGTLKPIMVRVKWRATLHSSEHGIGVVVRRESHREVTLRRAVHVRSRERRKSSIHSVHSAHAIRSTWSVVEVRDVHVGRRHVWRERPIKPVEELERNRRSVDSRRWEKGRGRRRSLLVLSAGEAGRRSNLAMRLRRRRLGDRLVVPSGWGAVVVHDVKRSTSVMVDGAGFLVRTGSKHLNSRIIKLWGDGVVSTVSIVQDAGINGWWGRHLRRPILVMNGGRCMRMLLLAVLLRRRRLLTPHETHEEGSVRFSSLSGQVMKVILRLQLRLMRVHASHVRGPHIRCSHIRCSHV